MKKEKVLDEIKKIYVVPYSHHDHAWTNTRAWHIWRYLEGYCLALDLMAKNKDYRLTIDNVLHSLEVFERYCPHRLEEFRQRIAEGRIEVVNGGLALLRPSLFDGELYLRNIIYGRRELKKRLGKETIPVFLNADTGVGHSQMPQILKLNGHEYYRFYRPEAALDDGEVPREIRWRGLDGTEILASRGVYGGCLYAKWAEHSWDDWDAVKQEFVDEDIRNKLPLSSTDELLLNIGLDDALPLQNIYDKELDIPGLMEQWNNREKSRMEFASLEEFFQSIDTKQIPVWDKPLDPCELSYNPPMRSDTSLWRKRLEGERLLVLLEKLLIQLRGLGYEADDGDLPQLWQRVIAFSGHAMQWLICQDYKNAVERADLALALIRERIETATDQIASMIQRQTQVQYAVINPCAFPRTENIELHVASPHHVNGLCLKDSDGKKIPYQFVETFNGDKGYADRDFNEVRITCNVQVPAFGYTSIFADFDGNSIREDAIGQMSGETARTFEIDNGFYQAEVVQGAIRKLIRKRDRQVLFASENGFGTIRLCHTTPTEGWTVNFDELAVDSFVPEEVRYREQGPIRFSFVSSGRVGRHPAQLETIFVKDSPRITFRLTLDNQGCEGYFSVGFPCDRHPQIRAGIPFGEEARDTDAIHYVGFSKDAPADGLYLERGWTGGFYANGYASYLCRDIRMALLQMDCSVYYRNIGERQEIELMLMRSFRKDTREEGWMQKMEPGFYGKGVHHFSYALTLEEDVQAEVQSVRQPLQIATRFAYFSGTQPVEQSLMGLSDSTLQLTAAYRENGVLQFRFFESRGEAGSCRIRMPVLHKTARLADIQGNTLRMLPSDGRVITLDYGRWEICTIALEEQEA